MPEVKVRLPAPLRKLAGGKSEIKCSGTDVYEVINDLDKRCPGMLERLLDDKKEIRRFINIFINGEDIRFLKGKNTRLKKGDEISIIPAIAGG